MHCHSLIITLICGALDVQFSVGATLYPTAGLSIQSSISGAPSSSGWFNSSKTVSTSSIKPPSSALSQTPSPVPQTSPSDSSTSRSIDPTSPLDSSTSRSTDSTSPSLNTKAIISDNLNSSSSITSVSQTPGTSGGSNGSGFQRSANGVSTSTENDTRPASSADKTTSLSQSSITLVNASISRASSSIIPTKATGSSIPSFDRFNLTTPMSVSASAVAWAHPSVNQSSNIIDASVNHTSMTKTDLSTTYDSQLPHPSSGIVHAANLPLNISSTRNSSGIQGSAQDTSKFNVSSSTLPGHLSVAPNIAMLNTFSIYTASVRAGKTVLSDYRPLNHSASSVAQPNKTSGHTSPGLATGRNLGLFMNSSIPSGYARATGTIPASITGLPKPTGYFSGTPIWPLNATLPPQLDYGIMSLSHGGICRMGQSCADCTNYNAQSCSCANSVSKWWYGHNRTTITTRLCSSKLFGPIAGTTQPMTCSMGTTVSIAVPYDAPQAHCCDKCDIRASEVQLVFWPDTGASNAINSPKNMTLTASTLEKKGIEGSQLVSDGYTYISPSVYIQYKSLQASVSCVTTMMAASAWSPIGPAISTIRPYEAKALSTAKCFGPSQDGIVLGFIEPADNYNFLSGIFNGWEAVDYQGLISVPSEDELISRYQTCFPQLTTKLLGVIATEMYTAPRLSIPGDVTDIHAMWKSWGRGTCTPVGFGAADPPRVLKTKTAMISDSPAPTVSAIPESEMTSPVPASPAAAPTNGVTATRTSVTSAEDPSTSTASPDSILPSDPTRSSAVLATSTLPIIDPVTTIDPNDPGLKGDGGASASNIPGPIYEAAATNQGPSPPSPAILPANVDTNWPATTQALQMPDNVGQAPPNPSQVFASPPETQVPNAAPVAANPDSIPITLSPVQPAESQNSPNSPPAGIAPFIAQAFSGEPWQPVATQDSQTKNEDSPAQEFEPGGPGQGSTTTNPTGASEGNAPVANQAFGSHQIAQSVDGGLQVGDQTLIPGSQATISGHTVDYPNPSSLVVDKTTYSISPISDKNPLVIDNQAVQRGSSGALIVADSTVQPDQQAVIAGHTYSLAGTSDVVVDQSTYALPPTDNAYLIQAQPTPTPPALQNTPVTLGNGMVITPQIAPSKSLNIDSEMITPAPTGFIVGGASILPGAPAVTISGTPISLDASSHLYVGSSVMTLDTAPSPSVFTIGSQTITPEPSGFAIGPTSISPGGPAVTVSGTVLSLDLSSHLRIGSSTITLNSGTLPTPSIFTAGGVTFSANPNGFIIGSAAIVPGGPATTVDGTVISLDASSHLYIGASVATLPSQTTSIFTVGKQTFTANPTGFMIGSAAIVPGGPATTVDGTVISLDASSHLYIGSSVVTLPSQTTSVFIVAKQTFTANPTGFVIGGATIIPGGPATTIDGTVVSLDASSHLYIGSLIATLASPTPTASVFTIGTQTFTANPNGFQIAGTTLTPGGAALTISGTIVSLGQNGVLDIGSSTISLLPQLEYLSTMANGIITTVKVSSQTESTTGLAQAESGSTVGSETSNTATAGVDGLIKGTGGVADMHKSMAAREGRWGLWIMTSFWGVFVIYITWVL